MNFQVIPRLSLSLNIPIPIPTPGGLVPGGLVLGGLGGGQQSPRVPKRVSNACVLQDSRENP